MHNFDDNIKIIRSCLAESKPIPTKIKYWFYYQKRKIKNASRQKLTPSQQNEIEYIDKQMAPTFNQKFNDLKQIMEKEKSTRVPRNREVYVKHDRRDLYYFVISRIYMFQSDKRPVLGYSQQELKLLGLDPSLAGMQQPPPPPPTAPVESNSNNDDEKSNHLELDSKKKQHLACVAMESHPEHTRQPIKKSSIEQQQQQYSPAAPKISFTSGTGKQDQSPSCSNKDNGDNSTSLLSPSAQPPRVDAQDNDDETAKATHMEQKSITSQLERETGKCLESQLCKKNNRLEKDRQVSDVNMLKRMISEQERTILKLQTDVSTVQDELTTTKEKLQHLQAAEESMRQENANQRNAISQLQAELRSFKDSIKNSMITKLQQQQQGDHETIVSMKETIQSLKASLSEKNLHLMKVTEERDEELAASSSSSSLSLPALRSTPLQDSASNNNDNDNNTNNTGCTSNISNNNVNCFSELDKDNANSSSLLTLPSPSPVRSSSVQQVQLSHVIDETGNNDVNISSSSSSSRNHPLSDQNDNTFNGDNVTSPSSSLSLPLILSSSSEQQNQTQQEPSFIIDRAGNKILLTSERIWI